MNIKSLAILAAIGLSTAPALASPINAVYQAVVSTADGTTANTGLTDGQIVDGSFVIDSVTGQLLSSTLDGFTVSTGDSTAAVTPTKFSALYQLGTQAIYPTDRNNSITVMLNALATFNTFSAMSLLTDSTLTSQLDLSGSPFGSTAAYLNADAGYTDVTKVFAYITSFSVVPEPATIALFSMGLAGLAVIRRRARPTHPCE